MNSTLSLEELYRPIEHGMDGVRAAMNQLWLDALQLVGIEGQEMPRAGGKLMRPALCLMSAGALGAKDLSKYVGLAAAFEALHVASLAHDDVIDRALMRRGSASLTGFWNNHAAVLGGDYLVARSVEMLATYDSCPVIANAIRSVRCMAEGELYFFNRKPDDITREDCIMLAERKTASLFAEAVSAPAHILDHACRAALHRFGISLGIAFQLIDDMLDITQPTETLGKPACGDVAEGKQTLPIMYLREQLGTEERARLDALRDAEMTGEDRAWIIGEADRAGVRAQTLDLCQAYMDEARGCLTKLPASPYRESMDGMLDFVLVRAS